MAGFRSTGRWHQIRKALRDQRLPCAICGQAIDYEAPAGTPNSFEADHIQPVALRPDLALDPANLQASHKLCNNRKNKRVEVLGIGLRSRAW